MEVISIFIVCGVSAVLYYAWKEYNNPGSVSPVNQTGGIDYGKSGRRCLSCGYQGPMKTWLSNYSAPQLIVLIGFLFFFIPGLIFIALYWGKRKCPSCGAIGKNQPIIDAHIIRQQPVVTDEVKVCPFCAETIKNAAVVCRYCNRDLPTS
jgi:hypothetical protein